MAHSHIATEAPSIATGKVFYRPELDALRFLAFMMVFLHHVPPFRHLPGSWIVRRAGGYGVCIFFMLSAYLIGELLIRESEKTGTVHVRAFFTRRVLRIWPLYFLALALGFSLGEIVAVDHIPIAALPYMLLLGGNFWVARVGWQLGALVPMWSLSVEEQFYILVPALMRFGGRKALMVMSLVCISAAYAALVWFGLHGTDAESTVWVSSLVQFQFFGAGTILALSLHGKVWRARLRTRIAMLVGGLTGLCFVEQCFRLRTVGPVPIKHLVPGYASVLLCCLSIFLAFLDLPFKPPRAITSLGRISFGLYVYHYFVLQIIFQGGAKLSAVALAHEPLMLLLCLILTIGLAKISFRYFEKPLLRYKERFSYVRSGV